MAIPPQPTDEQRTELHASLAELHAAMQRFARAYVDAIAPGVRVFAAMVARVEAADRARDQDRPAWQSPYGPRPRHR